MKGGGSKFAKRLAAERKLLLGELRGCLGVVGCYGTFQVTREITKGG
jgi:hypothetical protein